jgi:hypothetical protein
MDQSGGNSAERECRSRKRGGLQRQKKRLLIAYIQIDHVSVQCSSFLVSLLTDCMHRNGVKGGILITDE